MNLASDTVIWGVLGLVLIGAEVFTTSFFLLFFGISALIVSLLSLVGLHNVPLQICIFAALAFAGLFLFRNKIVNAMHKVTPVAGDEDKTIVLTHDVPAHGSAQIVYQGTVWTAVNEGDAPFYKGNKAVIARMDGIKIILK